MKTSYGFSKQTGDEPLIISIVVPVFNEEEVINEFFARIQPTIEELNLQKYTIELIFVNDGSKDSTSEILVEYSKHVKIGSSVRIIEFSRNFGHQAAIYCGIKESKGEAVVTIDADLQDPPEAIIDFVEKWELGFDVVSGKRISRSGETILKKASAALFYRALNYLSEESIPRDIADFRLLSRRAVGALLRLDEADLYLRGMIHWIGFKQTVVEYERDARFAGKTHYTTKKMFQLARNGIIAFSTKPLRFAFKIAQVSFLFAISYSLYLIYQKLSNPNLSLPGYTSLTVIILWSFSFQTFVLGIFGEYQQFIYSQTKKRPNYIIMDNK